MAGPLNLWSSLGALQYGKVLLAGVVIFVANAGVVHRASAQARVAGQPTGTISGHITDATGAPVEDAQVYILSPAREARTSVQGTYTLAGVPPGTYTLHVRLVGYRAQQLQVTVAADQTASQDFQLARDPLSLSEVVVTGTVAPRSNMTASVPITVLTPSVIQQSQPQSTTEMLRYVPGFTRIESSGGEVNQNISVRGILGVEYVMFMEDGLPVFPTMHTFFMNADNLFRPDDNIASMEVVRGGSSALFGSNTPGAVVNFINKTGGSSLEGTMAVTGGTGGLARYDFNLNGPLSDEWRFNVGGFYRYDHGIRDPGFPGTYGGQFKGSLTRLLSNGYIRFTGKFIDDRNQFILDLPFVNPGSPVFVPGFGDYGSMNTNQGLDITVPTPAGNLRLPLGDGLRTRASWLTADVQFDLPQGFTLQNAAQVMQNSQGWNAILPFNVFSAGNFVTAPTDAGGLGYPAGTTFQYLYTNVRDAAGKPLPFSTPNGLVAPGGEWHVNKPLTAVQDQFSLRKNFGDNVLSAGAYVAHYTQTNQWYFTDILTDVQNIPNFLDLVVTPPGGTPINVTKDGFRHYLSNYVNGTGQATIGSGVIGGDFMLIPKLRASAGVRWEWDNFVQNSENTSNVDLDGDPATTYDIETWGNGSYRHFNRSLSNWAGSIGLNYTLQPGLAVYASTSRGYKMPALDEFLNAQAEQQVALFEARTVQSTEAGIKYDAGFVGATLNGFYTVLKNQINQGAVVGADGRTTWVIQPSPDNKSYGAEGELVITPVQPLQVRASGTWLRAELGNGAGANIGRLINGVPASIGNVSATYDVGPARLLADWHYVAKRFADVINNVVLPSYNYFNFGASYTVPGNTRATVDLNVLNAFQSHGLEEGNPRLVAASATNVFLARPLLPRRFTAGVRYRFF